MKRGNIAAGQQIVERIDILTNRLTQLTAEKGKMAVWISGYEITSIPPLVLEVVRTLAIAAVEAEIHIITAELEAL